MLPANAVTVKRPSFADPRAGNSDDLKGIFLLFKQLNMAYGATDLVSPCE